MITYLLAVFLFGQEATRPPTIVSPHTVSDQCYRAAEELNSEFKKQGVADTAYAACLKIEHGQPA